MREYITYRSAYSNAYIGAHHSIIILVGKTQTKILKVGSRHTVYLEKSFVEDTNFPFKPAEPLVAKIEKNRVILERA